MAQLLSYPMVVRANYVIKMSAIGGSFLVVADHLQDPKKFFIKHFIDVDDAAAYLDFMIEKDMREYGGY